MGSWSRTKWLPLVTLCKPNPFPVARAVQVSEDGLGYQQGKIKMVFDRLRGIERENLPLSRRQTVNDQETEAQENILSSVDRKTPKEHQIGE